MGQEEKEWTEDRYSIVKIMLVLYEVRLQVSHWDKGKRVERRKALYYKIILVLYEVRLYVSQWDSGTGGKRVE